MAVDSSMACGQLGRRHGCTMLPKCDPLRLYPVTKLYRSLSGLTTTELQRLMLAAKRLTANRTGASEVSIGFY